MVSVHIYKENRFLSIFRFYKLIHLAGNDIKVPQKQKIDSAEPKRLFRQMPQLNFYLWHKLQFLLTYLIFLQPKLAVGVMDKFQVIKNVFEKISPTKNRSLVGMFKINLFL